jgi:hypothetical protein
MPSAQERGHWIRAAKQVGDFAYWSGFACGAMAAGMISIALIVIQNLL